MSRKESIYSSTWACPLKYEDSPELQLRRIETQLEPCGFFGSTEEKVRELMNERYHFLAMISQLTQKEATLQQRLQSLTRKLPSLEYVNQIEADHDNLMQDLLKAQEKLDTTKQHVVVQVHNARKKADRRVRILEEERDAALMEKNVALQELSRTKCEFNVLHEEARKMELGLDDLRRACVTQQIRHKEDLIVLRTRNRELQQLFDAQAKATRLHKRSSVHCHEHEENEDTGGALPPKTKDAMLRTLAQYQGELAQLRLDEDSTWLRVNDALVRHQCTMKALVQGNACTARDAILRALVEYQGEIEQLRRKESEVWQVADDTLARHRRTMQALKCEVEERREAQQELETQLRNREGEIEALKQEQDQRMVKQLKLELTIGQYQSDIVGLRTHTRGNPETDAVEERLLGHQRDLETLRSSELATRDSLEHELWQQKQDVDALRGKEVRPERESLATHGEEVLTSRSAATTEPPMDVSACFREGDASSVDEPEKGGRAEPEGGRAEPEGGRAEPEGGRAEPEKSYATLSEKWLDMNFTAEQAAQDCCSPASRNDTEPLCRFDAVPLPESEEMQTFTVHTPQHAEKAPAQAVSDDIERTHDHSCDLRDTRSDAEHMHRLNRLQIELISGVHERDVIIDKLQQRVSILSAEVQERNRGLEKFQSNEEELTSDMEKLGQRIDLLQSREAELVPVVQERDRCIELLQSRELELTADLRGRDRRIEQLQTRVMELTADARGRDRWVGRGLAPASERRAGKGPEDAPEHVEALGEPTMDMPEPHQRTEWLPDTGELGQNAGNTSAGSDAYERDHFVERMQGRIMGLSVDMQALSKRIAELQRREAELTTHVAERDRRIEKLQSRERELTADAQERDRRMEALHAREMELAAEAQERDRRLEALRARENELATNIQERDQRIEILQRREMECGLDTHQLNQRIGWMQSRERELGTDMLERDRHIAKLQGREAELTADLQARSRLIEALQDSEAKCITELRGLKEHIEGLHEREMQLSTDIRERDLLIETLQCSAIELTHEGGNRHDGFVETSKVELATTIDMQENAWTESFQRRGDLQARDRTVVGMISGDNRIEWPQRDETGRSAKSNEIGEDGNRVELREVADVHADMEHLEAKLQACEQEMAEMQEVYGALEGDLRKKELQLWDVEKEREKIESCFEPKDQDNIEMRTQLQLFDIVLQEKGQELVEIRAGWNRVEKEMTNKQEELVEIRAEIESLKRKMQPYEMLFPPESAVREQDQAQLLRIVLDFASTQGKMCDILGGTDPSENLTVDPVWQDLTAPEFLHQLVRESKRIKLVDDSMDKLRLETEELRAALSAAREVGVERDALRWSNDRHAMSRCDMEARLEAARAKCATEVEISARALQSEQDAIEALEVERCSKEELMIQVNDALQHSLVETERIVTNLQEESRASEKKMKEELSVQDSEINSLRAEREDLETSLGEEEERVRELCERKATLQEQLDAQKREMVLANERKREMEERVAELQRRVVELEKSDPRSSDETATQEDNDKLLERIERDIQCEDAARLKQRVVALMLGHENRDAEIGRLSRMNKWLKSQLADVQEIRAKFQKAERELDKSRHDVQKLTAQLMRAMARSRTMEDDGSARIAGAWGSTTARMVDENVRENELQNAHKRLHHAFTSPTFYTGSKMESKSHQWSPK